MNVENAGLQAELSPEAGQPAEDSHEQVTPESVEAAPEDGAEPDDGDGESTTPEDGAKPKKAKGGFQRRIDELTRRNYETQQALEQAQRERAEIQAYLQQQQMETGGDTPFPTLESAGYNEALYQQQVQEWHQQQMTTFQERQQQAAYQQQQQEAERQRSMSIQRKMVEATKEYPDFMTVINDPAVPNFAQLNPAAAEAAINSDQFARISYYLANNPSEMYAYADMNPVQAVMAIGRLEAKLTANPVNATRPPPPPPKIGSSGGSAVDPSKMTTDEWIAWRNEQTKR